jgi:hypothetical protein
VVAGCARLASCAPSQTLTQAPRWWLEVTGGVAAPIADTLPAAVVAADCCWVAVVAVAEPD